MVKPPRPPGDTHSPARRSPPDLTLRDQFAMAALIGNMANPNIRFQSFDEMATESYQMADAMMKARGE